MNKLKLLWLFFGFFCGIIYPMGLFTWGSLPKDQESAQLISEYVSEAIIAHEQDPTAHLGDGEALQQHKNNEVIDHPAFSVLDDKMAFDRNVVNLEMGTLTPYNKTGGVEINGINTWSFYSSTSASPQNLWGYVGDLAKVSEFSFSKNPRIITTISVSGTTLQQGYILVGETDEGNGFGFKIYDNKLSGLFFDSSNDEHLVEIQTLSTFVVYKLEARVLYPGTIEFYVNNILAGSFSSVDLDITMSVMPSIPWIDFKSRTTTSRYLFIRGFYWEAEI
jgi:hypothetical protein